MNVDCEFIRQCEQAGQRFKAQLQSQKSNANKKKPKLDPCEPDPFPDSPDVLRYECRPLPRFAIQKPKIETHPPVAQCEGITTNKFYYDPKPVGHVDMIKPGFYHYKPTDIFVGSTTYSLSYKPHVLIDEIYPPDIALLPPNVYEKTRNIETRPPCETTTRAAFYKKPIPKREPRLWWQKSGSYITPIVAVDGATSTSLAYTAPPYSKPVKRREPRGNIYFGDYRLRMP